MSRLCIIHHPIGRDELTQLSTSLNPKPAQTTIAFSHRVGKSGIVAHNNADEWSVRGFVLCDERNTTATTLKWKLTLNQFFSHN
jgi:hypothetical protein